MERYFLDTQIKSAHVDIEIKRSELWLPKAKKFLIKKNLKRKF